MSRGYSGAMRSGWAMRALAWAGALVAGAVFGAAGTIMHTSLALDLDLLPIRIVLPGGLVLSAVGCLALLVAVRCLADDRGATLFTGVGMLMALFVFSNRGPGGSVIVPQTAEGEPPLGLIWAWTLAVVVVAVVAWPDLRRLREASARAANTQ